MSRSVVAEPGQTPAPSTTFARTRPALFGSMGLLILVTFFLPWLSVSCQGQPVIALSGVQLAAGVQVDGQDAGANAPFLWLLPVVALVVVMIGAFCVIRQSDPGYLRPVALVGCAMTVIPLVATFFIVKNDASDSQVRDAGVSISTLFPFWLATVSGVGLGASGLLRRAAPPRAKDELQRSA